MSTIEQVIADTIRENIEEAIKDAVDEALAPIFERLDAIQGLVKSNDHALDRIEQAIDAIEIGDISYAVEELAEDARRRELNEGRAQLRLMREGKAS